ncbi:alpha/beta hydrolase [Robertmurraya kyonggiensis]|uniref:Alpha/beta hydrolase n=1 Tax=Robertmurraya kyonggiensis TaxID=1037680 RepID=A0A4U1D980_9BACI|nr:alpha/beta hydrolase [Robertmurraya kyonggiensis]TKC19052.1 alpha/beta hydrolase [Robertmurraya kyonggiensis]
MPVEPKSKFVLEQINALGMPPLETLTAEQLRASQAIPRNEDVEPVGKVEDRTIPGPGGELKVRVYYPKEEQTSYPGLVYFHGGGWVIGDLDSHDSVCRALTNHANCVTISVDYRLAPENKFPAAVDDAYASVQYIQEHAEEFQIDPSRIAVGGDSAGATLSVVVTNLAKQDNGPKICYQVLFYPSTAAGVSTPTASSIENAEGYFLTGDLIKWFMRCYLNNNEEKLSPLVTPMFFEDLTGLPPAIVITAEYDPLRDEGEAYAEKLKEAGVEVDCIRYDGTFHGFVSMSQLIDLGKDALEQAGKGLAEAFSKTLTK